MSCVQNPRQRGNLNLPSVTLLPLELENLAQASVSPDATGAIPTLWH